MVRPSKQAQSGVALVVVLWALVLLTTIAASVTVTQRAEIDLNRSLQRQVQARQLANAGISYAVLMLQLKDVEHAWQADGNLRPFQFGEHRLSVAVYEEQGLVDLNRADVQLIGKALVAVGIDNKASSALTDAIEDWKDKDDVRRLQGAEERQYRELGLGYGPVNGPFRDLAELRLVPGVTADLYLKLREMLTVDSGRAQVNLLASPPAVRSWLSSGLIGSGDKVRRRAHPSSVATRGGVFFGGGATQGARDGLRIHVEVVSLETPYVAQATVVLDNRDRRGFRIVKWHEAGVKFARQTAHDGPAG